MTDVERGTRLEPLYTRIVAELAHSLERRVEFALAWDMALTKHTPDYSWNSDADAEEDSIKPIDFLRQVCEAHYNFRLSELEGNTDGEIGPPIYAIFLQEDNESHETVRTSPTPRGGHR